MNSVTGCYRSDPGRRAVLICAKVAAKSHIPHCYLFNIVDLDLPFSFGSVGRAFSSPMYPWSRAVC